VVNGRGQERVIFRERARQDLKAGIDVLARAARLTLGPKGRNVAIVHKDYAGPRLASRTHFILDDMALPDGFQNVGAQILRQVAAEAGELVGDGTTTAIVLAHAMVVEGSRLVAAGANPMQMRQGIERACETAIEAIASTARKVGDLDEIRRLASAWANDEAIGDVIAQAVDRIGENGMVSLERSNRSTPLSLEYVEGMTYDRGYISPMFVTSQTEDTIELSHPYILVTDAYLEKGEELVPLLEKIAGADSKELLVIAPDVKGSALSVLSANNAAGVVRCVAIRAPEVNEYRQNILEDMAIWSGGNLISKSFGDLLPYVTLRNLGRAQRVVVDSASTTIIGGAGDQARVADRIGRIKAQAAECDDPYKKERMDRRVARMAGGVAVIWYGGATDAERNERRLRLEDAVSSLWASVRAGVVPGGGVALLNAASALDQLEARGDEALGIRILRRALEEPLRQIVVNADGNPSVVVDDVRRTQRETGNPNMGYDVVRREYCDLSERGTMDPTEVVCAALDVAASCAAMVLTTEAIVYKPPVYTPPQPAVEPLIGGSKDPFGVGGYERVFKN
jgi:chaperonin GroEL